MQRLLYRIVTDRIPGVHDAHCYSLGVCRNPSTLICSALVIVNIVEVDS